MKVKFKENCILNNEYYFIDDELEITKENYEDVWKLNEKGFISPITMQDYLKAKKEINKPKYKEEK